MPLLKCNYLKISSITTAANICLKSFSDRYGWLSRILTDPFYYKQVLVLTYPLIGNYGVPEKTEDEHGILTKFESDRIWPVGLVVGEYCDTPSHWESSKSLSNWLKVENVPGLSDIDTRELTKYLREKGSALGMIVPHKKFK